MWWSEVVLLGCKAVEYSVEVVRRTSQALRAAYEPNAKRSCDRACVNAKCSELLVTASTSSSRYNSVPHPKPKEGRNRMSNLETLMQPGVCQIGNVIEQLDRDGSGSFELMELLSVI